MADDDEAARLEPLATRVLFAEVMRESERAAARKIRGECFACGHRWTPRNPSTKIRRCPACQLRGQVTFIHLVNETLDPPAPRRRPSTIARYRRAARRS